MKDFFTQLTLFLFLFGSLTGKAQNFHFKVNPSPVYFDKPQALQKAGVSNVHIIYKDSRGFMWIGTENGLYRFDGTNVLYTHHINGDSTSLSNNNISSISEDSLGNIWVGTPGGGFILNAYTFQCTRIKDMNANFIGFKMSFFTDNKKTIWAATDDGLYRYNNQKKYLVKIWDGKEINNGLPFAIVSIGFYTRDTLVLGTVTGIVFINKYNLGSRLVPFYENGKVIKFPASVVHVDDDGDLWMGSWTEGLLHYNKASNKFLNYKWQKDNFNGLSNIVNCITTIKTGNTKVLYFGCDIGIFKIPMVTGTSLPDENNISLFKNDDKNSNGISPGTITNFYKDDLDNLWIAVSNETGVNKFSVTIPMFHTLPVKVNGYVQASQQIMLGVNKYYCISHWHGFPALQIFDKVLEPVKSFMHLPVDDINPDAGNASSVAVDKQNRLWVSSWRGVIVMDKEFKTIKTIDHLNGSDTLSKDKNNYLLISGDSVWIASYKNGIDFFRTDFKKLGHISQNENGLNESLIWKMYKDTHEGVWLLGNAFFHRYNSATHQFKQYTFSIDGTVPSPVDIAERKDGSFLIATKNGLVHFNPTTEKYNYIHSPLLQKEDDIYSVCTDENDNAWFLTAAHIVQYNFNTRNFILYGKEDGLNVSDDLMNIRWVSINKFLIGQQSSFTLFAPTPLKSNISAPGVFITNATVNDSSILVANQTLHLDLPYYKNRINFNFSAINYTRPEQNNFAYRLKGTDTSWTYTYNGFVSYASLAPDSYLFEVKVQNYAGIWSEVQSVSIIINPPFWKTWWFIGLIMLAFAILFFAIVKYITQQNLKEKILGLEKEQAIEKERNRISRDMHDDLGSGLTKIAILTEVIKTQPSSSQKNIDKISETARGLVDNLDEMVWALNPKNDSLDKLAAYLAEYTQQFLEDSGIESSIDLPQTLSTAYISEEKRRNIFMAVKEFLNNSVKHSHAKNIILQMKQYKNEFEIILKDDGKGMEIIKQDGMGNGIKNIQQRIEDIGGKSNLISENNKGTALHILCPL